MLKRTQLPRPAAFLDRDGVINVDHGYSFRPETLVFTPTAIEGIRILNEAGFLVLVVTNQSGVARGFYSTADVERFNDAIQEQLLVHGAHVDAFYYCPFHPAGTVREYASDHEDRKPNPGMLVKAMRDWPTDRTRSVMFGDKVSDMQAAARVQIESVLVSANDCDLAAAVRFFLQKSTASVFAVGERGNR